MPPPLPKLFKDPAAVLLGRKGGKAGKGPAKARQTAEQKEARRQGLLKYWASDRAKNRRKQTTQNKTENE